MFNQTLLPVFRLLNLTALPPNLQDIYNYENEHLGEYGAINYEEMSKHIKIQLVSRTWETRSFK